MQMRFLTVFTALAIFFVADVHSQLTVSAPNRSCDVTISASGDRPSVTVCPDGVRFVVAHRNGGDLRLMVSLYDGISNPVFENVDAGLTGSARGVAVDANRVAVFARKNGAAVNNTEWFYVDCSAGTISEHYSDNSGLDSYAWPQKLYYVAAVNKVIIPSWSNGKIYDIATNTFTNAVQGNYVFAMLPNDNGNLISMMVTHPAFGNKVYIGEFTYAGAAVGSQVIDPTSNVNHNPHFAERLDNGKFIIIYMRTVSGVGTSLHIRVYNPTTFQVESSLSNIVADNGGSPVSYEKLPDGKIMIVMSHEYNQMVVLEADALSVYAIYTFATPTSTSVMIRRDVLGFVLVQQQMGAMVIRQRFDMSGSYRCNTGNDCSCASGVCGMNVCVNQQCSVGFRPSSFVCRASNLTVACDPEEYCTGSSSTCPADVQSGGASTCEDVDMDPSCSDDGSAGTIFNIKCVFPYNTGRALALSAEGLVPATLNSVGRVYFPQGQSSCPRPDLLATPQGTATPWTFSYNTTTCKYTARLTIAPQSIPANWLFSNGSSSIAVGSDGQFNLVTLPINVGTLTKISLTDYSISNHLYTYTLRLPRALNTNATRYALKLFKLSDNNRGSVVVGGESNNGIAFSAILMGGLTVGSNRHVLTGTPIFTPSPSSPSLTCAVQGEIYVVCGPFVDTNAPTPQTITGVLQVNAACLEVGCVPRLLTLEVTFLAGDYESTVDGAWSTLAPLIWRRLENNDALDVELTNDVIVGGDKLILSVHFDAGSLSTLTKLFVTVAGFSGSGVGLVEYSGANSNNVFVIHDPSNSIAHPSTIIKNQAQQGEIDSFFRFPVVHNINFAVQWNWPSALPVDFRGQVQVDSYFDITIAAGARRQNSEQQQSYLLIQGPRSSVGDLQSDTEVLVLIDSASPVFGSFATCLALLALISLL